MVHAEFIAGMDIEPQASLLDTKQSVNPLYQLRRGCLLIMNTRCLLMLASGLLIAVPVAAAPITKPQVQSINAARSGSAVTAEIIRRSRSIPQSSFTVVDANLTAVQVTFTLDSQDNVIAISVDRDATFDVATDEAPISLSRGERAKKGDPYWEALYAKVIADVRHSMLLGLT